MRRILYACLLLLLASAPVRAAAATLTLITSQAITSSGNTPVSAIPTNTAGEVKVFVTTVSGTSPQLDLWLESCQDTAGSNCAPILATTVAKDPTTITASNPTVTTNARDIVDAKTTTTAEMFTATYQVLPAKYIRLRYIVSGTTPSFTMAAYYNGK